jgi:DNA-binding CsgD family transcriptional regulator
MSDCVDDGELLDALYETALDPAAWVPFMERFGDRVGGSAVVLSKASVLDDTGSALPTRIDPVFTDLYWQHFWTCNPLHHVEDSSTYLRNWTPKILTDEDWMPKEELLRSEYYNDFLQRIDAHSTLMIRLDRDGHQISVLNVSRARRLGQFGAAELEFAGRMHGHLIRAYRLSQKLSQTIQVREGLAAALDQSSNGVILVDANGRVLHANRLAERLFAEAGGLRLDQGRLTCAPAGAERRLQALIAAATTADAERRSGGSMTLAAPGRRLPLALMVSPLSRRRREMFRSPPAALVCVTDPEARADPPGQALRDQFDLTAAEIRVAASLFEGQAPNEAADALGLSVHTVRSHLARVFEKTHTNRQSELMRLMSTMARAPATERPHPSA